jgi:hypothetical protein
VLEEPRCAIRRCVHLRGMYQPDQTEKDEVPCCDAFPKGIPRQIAYGPNKHYKPFPGDHGIRYEREKA